MEKQGEMKKSRTYRASTWSYSVLTKDFGAIFGRQSCAEHTRGSTGRCAEEGQKTLMKMGISKQI